MPVLVAMVPVIVIIFLITLFSWRHLRGRCADSGRALKQFVQLTAVKPNTATGWAIVDFHALPIGHHQGLIVALWTFHVFTSKSS